MKVLVFVVVVLLSLLLVNTIVFEQFMTMEKAQSMHEKLAEAEKKLKQSRLSRAEAAGLNNEQMWMDGLEEDVELNCPSVKYVQSKDFNPPKKQVTTSLRCATCTLMKEFMMRRARLQVLKGRKPSAAFVLEGDNDGTRTQMNLYAGGEFCAAVYESYHLREQPDGERVWARRYGNDKDKYDPFKKNAAADKKNKKDEESPEEKKQNALAADKEALMKTHLVSTSGPKFSEDELLPVKFHNPEQRRMLPCSRYFLREMCHDELSKKEDALEGCFEKVVSMKLDKILTDQNGPWIQALEKCLDKALQCDAKFCHSRAIALAREQEWLEFAWYEGAFGNAKFSYIPELEHKGRNMLNPYRKGGEKEKQNPWLNGTWQQVESMSTFGDL